MPVLHAPPFDDFGLRTHHRFMFTGDMRVNAALIAFAGAGAGQNAGVITTFAGSGSSTYAGGGRVAGGIGTLFGVHLSNAVSGIHCVAKPPLPTSLAGVSLTLNGTRVPLFAMVNLDWSELVNFQFPWEPAGQTSVTAVLNSGISSSAPVSFPMFVVQPGIFAYDGVNGAFTRGDGSLVTPASPASPGDLLMAYATGLGPTDSPVAAGAGSHDVVLTVNGTVSATVKIAIN